MTVYSIQQQKVDIEKGVTAEEQKQLQLDKKALAIKAEADFVAQQIEEKQETYNQVESLMNDINSIAKDLNVNTAAQGEKLVRVD